jgi:signal peptidase II
MKRNVFIALLILVNITLDQISKFWVKTTVEKGSVTELIGEYFTLRYVLNEGAFLGMGSDLSDTSKLILLLILPAIVLGFVVYHMIREKSMDKLSTIGFAFVVGGGIANVFDRFAYGKVIDFLHIDLGFTQTGIFNIADMSVTTGMILILWASFFNKKKATTEEKV